MRKVRSKAGKKRPSEESNYDKIYRVVEEVPEGVVATYGQIASLAGLAGHARQVGYALHAIPEGRDLPWHRVINSRGEVSERSNPGGSEQLQRLMLEAEGVEFNKKDRVDLKRFLWQI